MNISRTQGNWLGFFICAVMMGYALYAQHVLGLEPCNLCVFQRLAVIAMGIVFLLAALHRPSRTGARVYSAVLSIAATFGVAVAGRHVYMQSLPPDEVPACGPGLEYLLDSLPMLDALRTVFLGSGQCADIDWSFLGLSMPMVVLISIIVVGGIGVWWNWRA